MATAAMLASEGFPTVYRYLVQYRLYYYTIPHYTYRIILKFTRDGIQVIWLNSYYEITATYT